jgi:hypothetical protein
MGKLLYSLAAKFFSHCRALIKNKPHFASIFFVVLAMHLAGIFYSYMHPSPKLNPNRKKLVVHTKILPPDPTKSSFVTKEAKDPFSKSPSSASTHAVKKEPAKKLPVKKEPAIKKKSPSIATPTVKNPEKVVVSSSKTKKLLEDLQESIAKIELNRDNSLPAKTITLPRPITELKADAYEIHADASDEEGIFYRDILIQYLKDTLHLPGYGTVKIKLSLEHQGRVENVAIASSDSEVNRLYLEKILQELDFPPFTGDLSGKNSYTFSLTFCSD